MYPVFFKTYKNDKKKVFYLEKNSKRLNSKTFLFVWK